MDATDSSTVALCIAAGLLLVYNGLAYALRQTGLRLALRANPAWAQRHLDEAGAAETTLAIQTLRNTVLVATFVGTLVFGQAVLALNTVAPATVPQEKARVVIQAALQVSSFLCFASVIRTAQHIGYMFGGVHELQRRVSAARKTIAAGAASMAAASLSAPVGISTSVGAAAGVLTDTSNSSNTLPSAAVAAVVVDAAAAAAEAETDEESAEFEESVLNLVRTQAWSFSLGFRFLYCSLPFAFGVAGAAVLFVASACIVFFLVYIDHAHEPCCHHCSGGGAGGGRRSARSRRTAGTAALLGASRAASPAAR